MTTTENRDTVERTMSGVTHPLTGLTGLSADIIADIRQRYGTSAAEHVLVCELRTLLADLDGGGLDSAACRELLAACRELLAACRAVDALGHEMGQQL